MVQQLGTLGDFAEALGLNPSTHIASHNTITPVLGYLMPSSDHHGYVMKVMHKHTCKKSTHNIKMK